MNAWLGIVKQILVPRLEPRNKQCQDGPRAELNRALGKEQLRQLFYSGLLLWLNHQ